MKERRREPRLTTAKQAKIIAPNRQTAIDCIIRNLSSRGACLEVVNSRDLPDAFELILGSAHSKHPCRVIWRQPTRVGVQFR